MKIEVDIKYKPKKDEVIIYDGEKWVTISIHKLLKEIKPLQDRIRIVEDEIKMIKGE